MRKKVSHRSFSDQPGYSHICAVCPFCGRINDAQDTATYCGHVVRWVGDAYHEQAEFTDGVNEEDDPR